MIPTKRLQQGAVKIVNEGGEHMSISTPVLLLLFNRPDTTAKVFESIKKVKPKNLYVAADGPRKYKDGETDLCEKVRNIIDEGIDWDCRVTKLYREENLGCGIAVSSAITWFFEHVEEGIILEDDTEPDISFFTYCENLLSHYRHSDQIMHISGDNFAPHVKLNCSYFFTRLPFIWGWATWRRAWNKYDFGYKHIPADQQMKILKKVFIDDEIIEYLSSILQDFHLKPLSYTWDYQWFLSIWDNNGLVIQPVKNLVQNIGYGKDATHTVDEGDHLSTIKAERITKIVHAGRPVVNQKLQKKNFRIYFKGQHERSYKQILYRLLKINSVKNLMKKLVPDF